MSILTEMVKKIFICELRSVYREYYMDKRMLFTGQESFSHGPSPCF